MLKKYEISGWDDSNEEFQPIPEYQGYRLCGDCARFVFHKAQSEYSGWTMVVITHEVPRARIKSVVHCYFENSSGDILADCRGEFSTEETAEFFKPFSVETTKARIALWGQKVSRFTDLKAFSVFVNEYWKGGCPVLD